MGNQGCSEWIAQDTATKLFQTAALLLGNEADAVNLVEETLSTVEVDPCADAANAQGLVQDQLVQAAIRKLSQLEPTSFAVVEGQGGNASCIEDDDISASGISPEQLSYLLVGDGRQQLQQQAGRVRQAWRPDVARAAWDRRGRLSSRRGVHRLG